MARILYDTHMHTPLCKHATGEPEEYAARAEARGLKGIVVTCHGPTEGDRWAPEVRMACREFDEYLRLVERAREACRRRVDVRLGLESDYVPGMEAWLEKLQGRADFDYVLGSVHCHLPQYRERFGGGEAAAFQRTYFAHLALSAEAGLFDCLGHPDLVKNEFPGEWHPESLLDVIGVALDRIARTGVAMELNTSGLHKAVPEMNPGPAILREMAARGIPVVVGSDAHRAERVGDDFELALELLEKAGYRKVSYYLGRRRRELSLAAARQSLAAAPGG